VNSTIEKFGYPASVIWEGEFWVVLLRPQQVTVGALVLAAKSHVTAFGDLTRPAFVELGRVTEHIEHALRIAFKADTINYLMLMMADPHVHFHVLPRYATPVEVDGRGFTDTAWPGPPDIKHLLQTSPATMQAIKNKLLAAWPR
jgi:diadenosine tetraphosphate (Ap4A) HIT family hydrolase